MNDKSVSHCDTRHVQSTKNYEMTCLSKHQVCNGEVFNIVFQETEHELDRLLEPATQQ
jgi:hypothetical protein